MKNVILAVLAFVCYIQIRIVSTPLVWRGIPNFHYWVADSERAKKQIQMLISAWIITSLILLFGWIGVLISSVWIGFGFIYIYLIVKKNNKWKEHSHF